MAIIRWEPFRDIERFFQEDAMPIKQIGWDLAVDIYEEDNNVIAEMNLPGIDPDEIDISVEDDILRVKGSREEKEETKEKDYYSKEIRRGSFERTVRLPSEVDEEKAEARYKDGVLKVLLPKKAAADKEKHKIQVRR